MFEKQVQAALTMMKQPNVIGTAEEVSIKVASNTTTLANQFCKADSSKCLRGLKSRNR